jgi:hypothetical protein
MSTQKNNHTENRRSKRLASIHREFYDDVSSRLYGLEDQLEAILGLVKAFHQVWRNASEDPAFTTGGKGPEVEYEDALVLRGLMLSIRHENETLIEDTRSLEHVVRDAYAGYF